MKLQRRILAGLGATAAAGTILLTPAAAFADVTDPVVTTVTQVGDTAGQAGNTAASTADQAATTAVTTCYQVTGSTDLC